MRAKLKVAAGVLLVASAVALVAARALMGPPVESLRATVPPAYDRTAGQGVWNAATALHDWEPFLLRVRAADENALEMAAALCPYLDTHPGEELLEAVGSLLALRPDWVLVHAQACHVTVDQVCAFLPEDVAPAQVGGVLDRREVAVRALLGGELKGQATECLGGLAEARRLLRR